MTSRPDGISRLAHVLLAGSDAGCSERETSELQTLAVEHGVDALLWDSLAGADGVAARLRSNLEPGVRAAAARDLFVRRELQNVCDAFAREAVPVLITKGTALAYTAYAQPWMRPRTDTDLLVRREDVQKAVSVLEACGYTRSDAVSSGELVSHQLAFERTDGHSVHHVVDLHWKIVNPQVVADALSFDDLWRDAQPAPALGASARVPSAVGSLALACVHRLAHHQGQERLIWLFDLKLLAQAFGAAEWTAFRGLVRSRRISGFCLDGLRAARTHLGVSFPQDVEAALAEAAPAEPSRLYVERPVTKRDVLRSDLATLGTWRERVQLLREHAFPSSAFMQQRYGTRSRWALPVLYVHRIVTGASKWVRS